MMNDAACTNMQTTSSSILKNRFGSLVCREKIANNEGIKQRQLVIMAPFTTSNDGRMRNINIDKPIVWIDSIKKIYDNNGK